MNERLRKLRQDRERFLLGLYAACNGSRGAIVNMWQLGQALGLSRDETREAQSYLQGEGVLRPMALGGGIAITHAGIKTVEAQLAAGAVLPELTAPTPAPTLPAASPARNASTAAVASAGDLLRSTFISYGGPDEPFARRLYEALHRNGVTTFFFPEHAVPGDKLHRMMRKGVNDHDRVILVCSRASLDRPGVLNEIEEALAREAREGGEALLIPVTLDDYVFKDWVPKNPDVAQSLRDRVVADFRGTDTDDAKFGATVVKLLGALRKKTPGP